MKALIIDLRTFQADNNIRRNTSAFAINYASASEDVLMQSFSILPGESKTINTPMNPSVVTLLRTTSPLTAQVTVRNSPSFNLTISKLLLLDADIASIVLTNPSATETAKVSLQQS